MNRVFRSIRLRLLLLAIVVTAAALALSGFGLVTLFGRHIERRIGQELDVYIAQIASGLEVDASGKLRTEIEPSHPRFAEPYGGLYWQVIDESNSAELRSRSVWDFDLKLPSLQAPPGEGRSSHADGPEGQRLFLREKRLVLVQPGADRPVRVVVAEDLADTRNLQTGFARDLVPGLAILGLIMLAGAWFQVGAGLRPLASVRRGVHDIRTGRTKRLDADVPAEIEQLVGEVNTLLDAQDASILRARDRAADLAHGLKTPLTALVSDAQRVHALGNADIASEIESVATRMHRTIERELARSRARQDRASVSVKEVADAIGRTLARTPAGSAIRIVTEDSTDLRVLMDPDDLYDVLGNLMENAVRAARSSVRISAVRADAKAIVSVEDDGADADPARVAALTGRGRRQDEAGGAGLGLAIVSDVLAAYNSVPEFAVSTNGGLAVRFSADLAPARQA